MSLPTKPEANALLEKYVYDDYQRHHALMVATAMEGYANLFNGDPHLWYVTGLLHDLDFEQYPALHPAECLRWFREWNFPEELIHAVEAHAYGYHGFTTLPKTKLAAALLACDEISGIFYAYRKLKKKLKEPAFAAKIDRNMIHLGCEHLGVPLDEHVANLVRFFATLP